MKRVYHQFPKQKFKIINFAMAFITLGIIFISIYCLVAVQALLADGYAEKLTEDAEEIQFSVNAWISDRVNLVEVYYGIITHLSGDDLTYSRTENKYVKIDYAKLKVDALYFGMSDGTFYTGKNWVPDTSYDPRVRPWYIGAAQSNGVVIGNTYIDSDTNKTIFTASKAFRTIDNAKGVIAIDIFMETVAAQLKQVISGTDFEAAIIDNQGIVLHYTGDSYLTGQPIETFKSNKVYLLYEQYKAQNKNTQLLQIKDNKLVMIDAIDKTPWTLLIFTNDENLINETEDNVQQFMLLMTLLAVFSLSSWILYKIALKLMSNPDGAHGDSRPEVDSLTKVFSRGYFDEKLESFWELGIKHEQPLSILLIDVDHYRKYASQYGQYEADQLLLRISREILKKIDPRYVLARYGGNVFAVICYQLDAEGSGLLAGEIVETVEMLGIPHLNADSSVVTVSVGAVGTVPSDAISIGQFIHMGFTALMNAKQSGRNTFNVKK